MASAVASVPHASTLDPASASLHCFVGSTRPLEHTHTPPSTARTTTAGSASRASSTAKDVARDSDRSGSLFASNGQRSAHAGRENQTKGLLNLVNAIEKVNKRPPVPGASVKLEPTISPMPAAAAAALPTSRGVDARQKTDSKNTAASEAQPKVEPLPLPNGTATGASPSAMTLKPKVLSLPPLPFNNSLTHTFSAPSLKAPQSLIQQGTCTTSNSNVKGHEISRLPTPALATLTYPPALPLPLPLPLPSLTTSPHSHNPSVALTPVSARRKSAFRPGKRLTRLQTRLAQAHSSPTTAGTSSPMASPASSPKARSSPPPAANGGTQPPSLSPNAAALVSSHRAQSESPTSSHSDSSDSSASASASRPMVAASRSRRDVNTLGGLSLPLLQVAELEHRATIVEGACSSPSDHRHYESPRTFRGSGSGDVSHNRPLLDRRSFADAASHSHNNSMRDRRSLPTGASAFHSRRPRSAWRRIGGHKRAFFEHRSVTDSKASLANKRRRRAKPKISPATGIEFQPCRGRPRGRHSFSFSASAKMIMMKVYALGVVSPSKSQLLAMVEMIRAEELHRRSSATSLRIYSDGELVLDPAGSPPPLTSEPVSPSNSGAGGGEPTNSGRSSPRSDNAEHRRRSAQSDEDTALVTEGHQDHEDNEDTDMSPIPSPLSSPCSRRDRGGGADADSPLYALQKCTSTNVRSFLSTFRSRSPMSVPLPHMSRFTRSDPGPRHWSSAGGGFSPLSRSQSHDLSGKLTSACRQLNLGASVTLAESGGDRESGAHPQTKELDVPPISESKVANRIKVEPVAGPSTADGRSTADCTHMDVEGQMKYEIECAHDDRYTTPRRVEEEEDETERAMSEHAKALLNLQALDDSVQAIDALSKRRSRSEPDIECREEEEAHNADSTDPPQPLMLMERVTVERIRNWFKMAHNADSTDPPQPLMLMEDDLMEGVTVERIRNWFKNRRYSAKKKKDKGGRRKNF